MAYKNPVKPILDLIRRENTQLGAIDALHGVVFPVEEDAGAVLNQLSWFCIQAPGTKPDEIMNNAARLGRAPFSVPIVNGRADFSSIVANPQDGNILVYAGIKPQAATSDGTVQAPVRIHGPDATITLYVNGAVVKRSTGLLTSEIILTPSLNVVYIVLERSILNNVVITVPPWLPVGNLPLPPGPPIWADVPAVFGFIGTQDSSSGISLFWADSAQAGSWRIERANYSRLTEITDVVYDSTEEQYEITVLGDHSEIIGDALVLPDTLVGSIATATTTGTHTTFFIPSDPLSHTTWTGTPLFVSDSKAIIVETDRNSITRTRSGYLRYVDTSISESVPYTYRLLAVHPLHPSIVSEWSEPVTIFAIDTTPPDDVIILSSTATISGDMVVSYVTPIDIDFAGVKVYRDEAGVFTEIATKLGRPGSRDQVIFFPEIQTTYWLRTFDWSDNIQPEGAGVSVVFDGTVFDPDGFYVPDITIEITEVDRFEQDILLTAVNPSGGNVRLQWAFGINAYSGLDQVEGPSPQTKALNSVRTVKTEEKVLRVRATNINNSLTTERVYYIDYDFLPEIVSVNYTPYTDPITNVIAGFTVFGTVDDDTRSITLTKESGEFELPAQTLIDTSSIKTFSFEINQELGEVGVLVITPNQAVDGLGFAGKPTKLTLTTAPITRHIVNEQDATKVLAILTANPSTATIHYMVYKVGQRPTVSFPPEWTSGVSSPATFEISRDPEEDKILEFYAKLPGATETIQQVLIDYNVVAEAYISELAEVEEDVLKVTVNSRDSDVASYRIWARPTLWPTVTGDEPSDYTTLHDRFARGGIFPRGAEGITFFAQAATWNVVVVGYDSEGLPGPISKDSILIVGSGGTPAGPGSLFNFFITVESGVHKLTWQHNSRVDSDYRVRVFERTPEDLGFTEITTSPEPAQNNVFFSPTPVFPAPKPQGAYVTYDYRVYLFETPADASDLPNNVATYSPSITGYYFVGLW